MNQTFNVSIDGYWREEYKSSIPSHSGVYFVYSCTHNRNEGTVSIHELIYIGESENVCNRIDTHEKWPEWRKYLKPGQEICFSTGAVASLYRQRVEAAYIYKHKPPVNTEYKHNFPFDQSRVVSMGKTSLLYTDFTVYRTN